VAAPAILAWDALRRGSRRPLPAFRQGFENQVTEKLTDMIEDPTGRNVIGYQTQNVFDPDVVIETSMVDTPSGLCGGDGARRSTRCRSARREGRRRRPWRPPSTPKGRD
jgi:hypothetical protein